MLEQIDLETVLPIDLVRVHCKIDDVGAATDMQLELYREAAFEAAEQYTGRIWRKSQMVEQSMATPRRTGGRGPRMMELAAPWSPYATPQAVGMGRPMWVNLETPAADGIITLFYKDRQTVVQVAPGATRFEVPFFCETTDGCGSVCGQDGPVINFGVVARYKGGVCNPKLIPAGIRLGCLKYIAWNVDSPGDRLEVVHDSGRTSATGIIGTNHGTWASGAIELWRQYRKTMVL